MDHASSYHCLLRIVSFLFLISRLLGCVGEIQVALVCVDMSLVLHTLESVFNLVAFSVNWTGSYHQLLDLLIVSNMLLILLILHWVELVGL
jgi:hypothetical protein